MTAVLAKTSILFQTLCRVSFSAILVWFDSFTTCGICKKKRGRYRPQFYPKVRCLRADTNSVRTAARYGTSTAVLRPTQ
jgi:hypothetical protein